MNRDLEEIKEAVNAEKISILNLLQCSCKLIKLDMLKLFTVVIVLQLISTLNFIFWQYLQKGNYSPGYMLLSSLTNLIMGSLLFLMSVAALFEIYDKSQFSLKNILATSFKKLFKFVWTLILPGLLVLALFFLSAIIYAFVSVFFKTPVILLYPLFVVLLAILFIWVFVPFYFLEYIVVASKYYGLTAMKISFKLVRGRKWRLFGCIMVILLITLIALPFIILGLQGYAIAYVLSIIPSSIIGLYAWSYGFLLYKHLVSKVEDGNLDHLFNGKSI